MSVDTLCAEARTLGIELTGHQLRAFERYLALLQEWAARLNLVGDASTQAIERRHFGESLALGALLQRSGLLQDGIALLDVGTGAGLPGYVLKIGWPGIQLVLLEATKKKVQFLKTVADALAIDVRVVAERAETAAHDPEMREAFDLVTARAVAPLPCLLELTLPFTRIGGWVALPKGSRVADEIAAAAKALKVLGGVVESVAVGTPAAGQSLVLIEKVRTTPASYPRRPGMPAKQPL